MIDYIVLFGLILCFILFCIFCRQKSSVFALGFIWFVIAIIRKNGWIKHINQLTNQSIDILDSQFQEQLVYSSYVMDVLMYLKFAVFAIAIVVFFIKISRKTNT